MNSGEIKLYLIKILSNSEVSENKLNLLMEKYKCTNYKEVLEKEIKKNRVLVKKQKHYHLAEKAVENILNNLRDRRANTFGDISLVSEFVSDFSIDEACFVFNESKEDFEQELKINKEQGLVGENQDEINVYTGNYNKDLINLVNETFKKRGLKVKVEDEDLAKLRDIFSVSKKR